VMYKRFCWQNFTKREGGRAQESEGEAGGAVQDLLEMVPGLGTSRGERKKEYLGGRMSSKRENKLQLFS